MFASLIFGISLGTIGYKVIIRWFKNACGFDHYYESFSQILAFTIILIFGFHLVFYGGNLSELWKRIAYKDVALESSFSILNLGIILFGCIFGAGIKLALSKIIPNNIGSQTQERQTHNTQKSQYKYTYQGYSSYQETSQKAEQFKPSPRPKTRRELHMDVLGLSYHCSKEEIKDSYRRLAKKYHPDQFVSVEMSQSKRAEIETKMKNINAAYSALMV